MYLYHLILSALRMPAHACEKEIIRLNRILEKPISAEKRRKVARKLDREWQKLYKRYGYVAGYGDPIDADYEGLIAAIRRISTAEHMAVKREFHRRRGDRYG